MFEEISKYIKIGNISNSIEKKDLEMIFYNNRIPYKINEDDEIFIAYKYEELGGIILKNYRDKNLIFKKNIDRSFVAPYNLNSEKKPMKKNYREYFLILLLIGLIILFYKSLDILSIL